MSTEDVSIKCPHCGEPFHLTEALAAPLLEVERNKAKAEAARIIERDRAAIEAKAKAGMTSELAAARKAAEDAVATRDREVKAAKEAELAALKAKQAAEQAQRDIDLQVQRQVQERSAEIARKAAVDASAAAVTKLKGLEADLAAKDAKLKEAQTAEIEARRLKAEAEEAKREAELVVARKLDEERAKVREAAYKERDDEHRLKAAEKDKQLEAMREQIEELRRKGSNGSQQLAGDVLELDLVALLKQAFPGDQFDRIPKGQSGADLLQTVLSPTGARCGTILWESKRTKTWQNAWLPKLREDQRGVTADVAVLATETLPSEVTTFNAIDGVWVTSLQAIIPIATALRHGLLEVSTARRAGALAESAKDKVFEYLVSLPFRQRVTRIVEAYEEMRGDLEKEKKAMSALWNKRDKQLDRMLGGVTGFYGDLQGIVGHGMPALEKLDLPAIELEG